MLKRIVIGAPLPSYTDIWRMFREGGDLEVIVEDLAQVGRAHPAIEYEVAKQLASAHLSILYYRSRSEEVLKESCNFLVEGRRGITIAYFTEGILIGWGHGGRYLWPPKGRSAMRQVLNAVRVACGLS